MDDHLELDEPESFADWAPLIGRWDLTDEAARYIALPEPEVGTGLALAPGSFSAGLISVDVRLPSDEIEELPQARIVFGFDGVNGGFYSIGLGGFNALYTAEQFVPQQGLLPLRTAGNPANLNRGRVYHLDASVSGQWATLEVNGVEVLEVPLPGPLQGSQFGLTAWGRGDVEFSGLRTHIGSPRAFVVMQFGEPYDTLYRDVIAPVCLEQGYSVYRADDVFGPGVILNDIIASIREATVIIAEVTPVNANVFYELGYAHATDKPVIMLAERGHPLPFDVQGFRCIYYDDTIGGKAQLEADLRRHLEAIGT